MSRTSIGWTALVAAMGVMCTLLAPEMAKIDSWSEATRPGFVAVVFGHLGAVIAAFVGGKIIPSKPAKDDR